MYIFFGKFGIYDIIKINRVHKELKKKLLIMEAGMIIMKHKIDLIEYSVKEQERLARERLGMKRDGENIIIIKEEHWKR